MNLTDPAMATQTDLQGACEAHGRVLRGAPQRYGFCCSSLTLRDSCKTLRNVSASWDLCATKNCTSRMRMSYAGAAVT